MTTLGQVAWAAHTGCRPEDFWLNDRTEQVHWEDVGEAVRDEVGKQLIRSFIT